MAAKKTVKIDANKLGLVPVRFVKPLGNYQVPDVAGFLPERAKALVDGGFAEPVTVNETGKFNARIRHRIKRSS